MQKLFNTIMLLFFIAIILGLGFFGYRLFLKNEDVSENKKEEISQEVEEDITETKKNEETFMGFVIDYEESESILSSKDDIELIDLDGNKTNYSFIYDNREFNASYTYDNWTIYDSYQIRNSADITIICSVLIDEHPVHGIDKISYRTAEDMAYEWLQHNIAYELLPESEFKNSAKDVDLDPDDQGKSLEEIYRSRYQ